MRITVDLAKASTEPVDLTGVLNPRVGDGDLKLPFHLMYNGDDYDMRGKGMDFLSEGSDKKKIYVTGTVDESTKGDDPYTGNVTFTFPTGTFKTPGAYDVDKTMFRVVNNVDHSVISTVNVKMSVLPNDSDVESSDDVSYDSRMEKIMKDYSDKGQASLDDAKQKAQQIIDDANKQATDYLNGVKKQGEDLLNEIKQTNAEAKGNVAGDTAATATQAKQLANDNSGKIHDLQGEVGDARGRFMTLSDRENKQDFDIDRKEDKANANANYAAQNLRNDAQDKEIAKKANQQFIIDYLSKMYLQPEGFANADELKAKYPSGQPGIMVTVDTGHKWIWYNNKWNDCGVYQASTNPNKIFFKDSDIVKPYDDLNNLPGNSTVSYTSDVTTVANRPVNMTTSFTVLTFQSSNKSTYDYGGIQLLYTMDGNYFYRSSFGEGWQAWKFLNISQVIINKKEAMVAPYDNLDTLPSNSIITYLKGLLNPDFPYDSGAGFTITTQGNGWTGRVQTVTCQNGKQYYRLEWDGQNHWTYWHLTGGHDSLIFTNKPEIKAPYDNLDTLPSNTTITYVKGLLENDFPYDSGAGFTIVTQGNGGTGRVQTVTCQNGKQYYRLEWTSRNHWGEWYSQTANDSNDYDLSLSIFGRFGVIGDSFSKGLVALDDNTTLSETQYKWGDMLAKEYGTTFYDFSRSGQTTKSCIDDALPKVKNAGSLDAYFIVLGINDSTPQNNITLGSIDDIKANVDDNPHTFYGDYARIITTAQTTSPKAKIVLFTILTEWGERAKYDAAIKEIGKHYNLPVINILEDPYFSSPDFKSDSLMSQGHPTVPGYAVMAEHLKKLIQKCVYRNASYFKFMGLN